MRRVALSIAIVVCLGSGQALALGGNAPPVSKGKLLVAKPNPAPTLLTKSASGRILTPAGLTPARTAAGRYVSRRSALQRRFERPVVAPVARTRRPAQPRLQLPSALDSLRLQLELEAMREHSR